MACIDCTDIIQALPPSMTLEQVDAWLDTPNQHIDGLTPTSAIVRGMTADVLAAARRAADPQP